jgi:hypothetical protein
MGFTSTHRTLRRNAGNEIKCTIQRHPNNKGNRGIYLKNWTGSSSIEDDSGKLLMEKTIIGGKYNTLITSSETSKIRTINSVVRAGKAACDNKRDCNNKNGRKCESVQNMIATSSFVGFADFHSHRLRVKWHVG